MWSYIPCKTILKAYQVRDRWLGQSYTDAWITKQEHPVWRYLVTVKEF
jgi:hypothetical protein